MREIKFRAFYNGKMYEVENWMFKVGMNWVIVEDESVEKIPAESIMQYTGLKDANGKEIYEGDIVKITNFIDMKTIYEIIWNEEVASFEYKDGPYINEYGDIIPGIHYPNECTVVGNICENPELLN